SRAQIAFEPYAIVACDTDMLGGILREIAAGRPAQYIVGYTEFCGLRIDVREGVLIPRPETEELVEWMASEAGPGATIFDAGTGSGAIAIALATRIADSHVHAMDISPAALETAAANARRNDAQVRFTQGDIFDGKTWERWPPATFDIIVSNPPYIPQAAAPTLHCNVARHEPPAALFVPNNDPLLFYRAIARAGHTLLKTGGLLFFEIYELFAPQMEALLEAEGYPDVMVRRDINGRERMIKATKR
ncbi:MAG: peptide chain release factor N(5)-glutamine methyltransferase, partial [Rikenellaceae bacterium]|nr:peptide chain release factor N(5)-glutamine methyltransferase [Rikenellaceae bacterium]